MISNSVMTKRLAKLTTHNNMHKYEFAFIKNVRVCLSLFLFMLRFYYPYSPHCQTHDVQSMKNKTINFIWCFLYETRFGQHFYGQFHHIIAVLCFFMELTSHLLLLLRTLSIHFHRTPHILPFDCNLQAYTEKKKRRLYRIQERCCLNFSIHK